MNQLYEITWQDAAYSYSEEIPVDSPGVQKTIGYIIEDNEDFINIAFSFRLNFGQQFNTEGFVIPKGVILNIKKLN